ncbi:hypothetical protein Q9290_01215 [Oceanimonas sp. CHS3-5]|uniref:hypothetical protein n=1 Tax=Oceanimonas sp. CHS3-5 TaxID=3068186 RepID=UPI00273D1F49|nr:hypothetical protein [Oceanimonas sp. CHS3-5]MDP5290917.1 hypothetical protein [Oceanimonas sp. CHS3-5]
MISIKNWRQCLKNKGEAGGRSAGEKARQTWAPFMQKAPIIELVTVPVSLQTRFAIHEQLKSAKNKQKPQLTLSPDGKITYIPPSIF